MVCAFVSKTCGHNKEKAGLSPFNIPVRVWTSCLRVFHESTQMRHTCNTCCAGRLGPMKRIRIIAVGLSLVLVLQRKRCVHVESTLLLLSAVGVSSPHQTDCDRVTAIALLSAAVFVRPISHFPRRRAARQPALHSPTPKLGRDPRGPAAGFLCEVRYCMSPASFPVHGYVHVCMYSKSGPLVQNQAVAEVKIVQNASLFRGTNHPSPPPPAALFL